MKTAFFHTIRLSIFSMVYLFLLNSNLLVQAQTQYPINGQDKEQLASQYFRDQQWEKAAALYLELYQSNLQSSFYRYYVMSTIRIGEFIRLEKFIKDVAKKYPSNNLMYEVDLGYCYLMSGDTKKGNKKFEDIIDELRKKAAQIPFVASEFYMWGQTKFALQSYLIGREISKDPYLYALDLANLYAQENDYQAMSNEFIHYAIAYPDQLQSIKNRLQNILYNDLDGTKKNALKRSLIQYGQKKPDAIEPQDILIWLAMQDKDFPLAYDWTIAVSPKINDGGKMMMALGEIALSNEDYETAYKSYQYIAEHEKNRDIYATAKINALNALYLSVINKPNYTKKDLLSIEKEYTALFEVLGKNKNTVLLMQNYAHLLAFYLDRKEEAISMLEEAINMQQANIKDVSQCKIELADIFILTGDVWDALLLYSQVDKVFKNNPIGYEAKLKNAKLSFYMGEFEWANAQLKILKAATDRFISNDAIELSLLITDNMESDSTFEGLRIYARADLLIAQHKYNEALITLDSIPHLSIIHSLNDDVMMRKADIAMLQFDYTRADSLYKKLTNQFPKSILADNALYQRALLNERKLNNLDIAKQCYRAIITDYSNSIYVPEARKELRLLNDNIPSKTVPILQFSPETTNVNEWH